MNGSQGIGALFLEHVRASGLVPLARLPEKLTRCGLSLVGDNMSPLSRVRSSIMRCMHGTAKRGLASSSRNRHQPAAFHLLVCPITKVRCAASERLQDHTPPTSQERRINCRAP